MDKTYKVIPTDNPGTSQVSITEKIIQEVTNTYTIAQCDDEISKCDMRIQDSQSEISKQLEVREKWSNIKEEITQKIEEAVNQKVEEVTNDEEMVNYSTDVPNL